MSRGFTKEGDQEEAPIIPPRADLPGGVTNYVTPNGRKELLHEREELERERKKLLANHDDENRRALMVVEAKLKQLNKRIASARIIDPEGQPKDEVRMGAIVEFNNGQKTLRFQIVGVDEADFKQQKIPFTAPIARALNGGKVNETVDFKRGDKIQKLEILSIRYPG
jgi:transcription elongation factor GreB